MSYPNNARIPVLDRGWLGGCNSLVFPTDIQPGSYYWGENVINRGGIIQTRPGRNLLFSLPGIRAQGLGFYRPYQQKEQLVWAIDGKVYWSEAPFITYTQLLNLQFDHRSPQVFFCQARQEAVLNVDGSITLLNAPLDIFFIQDGYTAPGLYEATGKQQYSLFSNNPTMMYNGDGTVPHPRKNPRYGHYTPQPVNGPLTNGHMFGVAPYFGLPTGTNMAFIGARLWVAQNETIFASDLLNPGSFTERTYLAEADGFKLPEPCSGMLSASNQDPTQGGGLFCFTPFTVTLLQAGILDRTQWQTTQGFQQMLDSDYGSVAAKSPVNQFGMPWFFSEVGWISMNQALQQYRTSTVNSQDNEMTRSKLNMSPLRTAICSISFENFVLVAVPSGSKMNRQTWVMDGSPLAMISQQAPPCWVGAWTGTYPVEFVMGEVQDVPRCFELSYSCNPSGTDASGKPIRIQLWENFTMPRADQRNTGNSSQAVIQSTPIECSFETRIFEVQQEGLLRFKYVEIYIVELAGLVDLSVWYAGIKGHYRKLHEVQLSAEEGMPGNQYFPILDYANIPTDTILDSFRPQVRIVRTPDFSGSPEEQDNCADTCGIETPYQHDVDKGFQLLFNWTGQMGIREIILFVEGYPQVGIGDCYQSEAGKVNIVSAIGCLPPPISCRFEVSTPPPSVRTTA